MKIGRRDGSWRLDTEYATYFSDSLAGFIGQCRRALLIWLAR